MADLRLTDDEVFCGRGAGQGATCCRFVLHDQTSFLCGRETELKQPLIDANSYTAQRIPDEPYPLCQLARDVRP